ncbi:hypothetical protein CA983_07370 [Streptomyces swartbergensis]|uniref:Uncharacterized protein n=1 Tax=Streptomyces swartbergensis TaxID=487165 RepID=A0A243S7Y5_9ACTN|nr:hypothetical protein CA983_07370 [Streptomyces swartbergensis]
MGVPVSFGHGVYFCHAGDYASLAEAVQTAGHAVPGSDPSGRLPAWGRPLREWARVLPGFALDRPDGTVR